MMTTLHENTGYTWRDYCSKAAYASEAVVHSMSKEGFSSAEVRKLFEARSGFMLRMHPSDDSPSSEENHGPNNKRGQGVFVQKRDMMEPRCTPRGLPKRMSLPSLLRVMMICKKYNLSLETAVKVLDKQD